MKSILFLVVALFLWGCVEARPTFFAGSVASPTGSNLAYSGVSLALLTSGDSNRQHELSVFGMVNIPDTVKITAVTLSNSSTGAFNISQLKWNQTNTGVVSFVFGNARLNSTSYAYFYVQSLYMVVYTGTGTIAAVGSFAQEQYTFFSFMIPDLVVPTPPTGEDYLGFAFANVFSSLTTFPTDIAAANNAYLGSLVMNAGILHNVDGSTSGNIYGPADTASTAGSIQTLAAGTYLYTASGAALGAANTLSSLYQGQAYFQVNSQEYPNGAIRGQAASLLQPRRREVPISIALSSGTESGDFSALYRATQYGLDNNKNSYITLNPNTTDNTFNGIFTVQLPIKKTNLLDLRFLTLEFNAKGDGSTWTFSYYNFVTKTFDSLGTFSNNFWTYAFVDSTAIVYLNAKSQVLLRVSATAATSPLLLDQLTIRPWVPNAQTNTNFRAVMRNFRSTFAF